MNHVQQSIIKDSSKSRDVKMDAQVTWSMCHKPDVSRKPQSGCLRAGCFHASSPCLLRQFSPKRILDSASNPSPPPWTQFLFGKRGYPREMNSCERSEHSCSSSVEERIVDCSGPKSDQHFLLIKTTARHLLPPYGERSSTWCSLPIGEAFGRACFHRSLATQESRVCQSTFEACKKKLQEVNCDGSW